MLFNTTTFIKTSSALGAICLVASAHMAQAATVSVMDTYTVRYFEVPGSSDSKSEPLNDFVSTRAVNPGDTYEFSYTIDLDNLGTLTTDRNDNLVRTVPVIDPAMTFSSGLRIEMDPHIMRITSFDDGASYRFAGHSMFDESTNIFNPQMAFIGDLADSGDLSDYPVDTAPIFADPAEFFQSYNPAEVFIMPIETSVAASALGDGTADCHDGGTTCLMFSVHDASSVTFNADPATPVTGPTAPATDPAVTPVPVPAGFGLLALAMAGLGFAGRRRTA